MKKEIVVPILNNEYKVVVCFGKPKEVEKVLRAWGHDPADFMRDLERRRGICYYTRDCNPVIAMPSFPRTNEEIGTLAHEAVHAVFNILQKIQQPVEDAEEIVGHSVGAIVREVLATKKKEIPNGAKRKRQ